MVQKPKTSPFIYSIIFSFDDEEKEKKGEIKGDGLYSDRVL